MEAQKILDQFSGQMKSIVAYAENKNIRPFVTVTALARTKIGMDVPLKEWQFHYQTIRDFVMETIEWRRSKVVGPNMKDLLGKIGSLEAWLPTASMIAMGTIKAIALKASVIQYTSPKN